MDAQEEVDTSDGQLFLVLLRAMEVANAENVPAAGEPIQSSLFQIAKL